MALDSVMLVASMAKLLPTIAVMQLIEQGILRLDDRAENHVPDISALQVLDRWSGGKPKLRPPARPITIRHLLSHTAGMPYTVWNAEQGKYNEYAGIPSVLSGDSKSLMGALMSDPGTRWEYGIATDWLSKVVESVSGKSIGAFLKAEIFEPLGLADTGYFITPPMRSRLAKVHARTANGTLQETDMERPQNPPVEEGGGGIYTTVADYGTILRMLLNQGKLDEHRILQPESVVLMGRNAIGGLRVRPHQTVMPAVAADLDMYPGVEKSFGLGLMILEEDAPTGRPAGSLSWAGIANTYFWIDPKNQIAGLWFSQTMPFLDADTVHAYYAFETAVYEALS